MAASMRNIVRARRGAAWLDRKLGPGWRRKILRRRLNMAKGIFAGGECGCILAQLDAARHYGRGYYSRGGHAVGIADDRLALALGFRADGRFEQSREYADLTEAWLVVLREREPVA